MGDTIPPDGRDTCWPHAPLRPQTPASPVGYPAGWRWCGEVMFVGAVCVEAHARRDGDGDAVAAWLGVDDGDRARFRCRAVQALTRGFGVVITIKGRASW